MWLFCKKDHQGTNERKRTMLGLGLVDPCNQAASVASKESNLSACPDDSTNLTLKDQLKVTIDDDINGMHHEMQAPPTDVVLNVNQYQLALVHGQTRSVTPNVHERSDVQGNERKKVKFQTKSEHFLQEIEFIEDLTSDEPTLQYCDSHSNFVGRYHFQNYLGGGGDGNVFSAIDKLSSPAVAVALKVQKGKIEPQDWPVDELQIIERLQGLQDFSTSNIVTMLGYFVHIDHIFMSFELLGPSLSQVLELNVGAAVLTLSETRHIIFQILTAARFLHKNGVIHTDIKPGNIVFVNKKFRDTEISPGRYQPIMDDTKVRLIDMDQCVYTSTGNVPFTRSVCTKQYRAPELFLRLDFDSKVDMWSIGCTAFEMLYNRLLFKSGNGLVQQLFLMELVVGEHIPVEMSKQAPPKYFDESGKLKASLKDEDLYEHWNNYFSWNLKTYDGVGNENEVYFWKLLKEVLQIDPKLRITANEALQNPWFNY